MLYIECSDHCPACADFLYEFTQESLVTICVCLSTGYGHACELFLSQHNTDKINASTLPGLCRCIVYSDWQVFFRSGALTSLELQRDEKITGTMQAFQALCRGYLGRKQLAKLRVCEGKAGYVMGKYERTIRV